MPACAPWGSMAICGPHVASRGRWPGRPVVRLLAAGPRPGATGSHADGHWVGPGSPSIRVSVLALRLTCSPGGCACLQVVAASRPDGRLVGLGSPSLRVSVRALGIPCSPGGCACVQGVAESRLDGHWVGLGLPWIQVSVRALGLPCSPGVRACVRLCVRASCGVWRRQARSRRVARGWPLGRARITLDSGFRARPGPLQMAAIEPRR